MELSTQDAIIRILIAMVLGSIVGYERETSQHSAGLRTHILVCIGSTVFTILSISDLTHGVNLETTIGVDYRIVRDSSRIAAQILTGIGFIGGGAVLRYGTSVRGVTTAASLWMIASIGMLVGSGYFLIASFVTILAYLVLSIIGYIERTFLNKHLKNYNRLKMTLTITPEVMPTITEWMNKKFSKEVLELKSASSLESKSTTLNYVINVQNINIDANSLYSELHKLPGIQGTNLRIYSEKKD